MAPRGLKPTPRGGLHDPGPGGRLVNYLVVVQGAGSRPGRTCRGRASQLNQRGGPTGLGLGGHTPECPQLKCEGGAADLLRCYPTTDNQLTGHEPVSAI
jgi:hypothetical protein